MTEKLAIRGGRPAVSRPLKPFSGISSEERSAVLRMLDGGGTLSGFHGSAQPTFFGGPEVRALEAAWCERYGMAHAVSMNSATSGLIAAMGAVGVGPGDEVIVPPFTMSATAIAPIFYGGIPVFADIDPRYFCVDPAAVERLITPATKAIIAVNLFGHPAELKRLRDLADAKRIYLVEDSAQAMLAYEDDRTAGTVGHIGVFSLNVHKHIQTGEGGICVTDDAELGKRLQLIRNHGENVVEWLKVDSLVNMVGFNFRMTELTAAVGAVQLRRMDELVGRVEAVAARLTAGVSDLRGIAPPAVRAGCRHNFYMWSLVIDPAALGTTRATFQQALTAEGFPSAEGYVAPIYRLPMFQQRVAIGTEGYPFSLRQRRYPANLCPVCEEMHEVRLLQFQPVSWDVDDDQVDMLIEAIRKVHRHANSLSQAAESC